MNSPKPSEQSETKVTNDGNGKQSTNGDITHDSITNTTNYLFLISSQIHDNIKFADQKAAFFSVINIALLSYIWSLDFNTTTHGVACYWCFWSSKLACCLILAWAIACSVLTIKPRGDEDADDVTPGIVDPVRIAKFGGAGQRETMLQKKSDKMLEAHRNQEQDIDKNLSLLILSRSHTNASKYKWIRRCFWASVAAWGISFALLITAQTCDVIQAEAEGGLNFNLINIEQSPTE